jgi:hypothetical protein
MEIRRVATITLQDFLNSCFRWFIAKFEETKVGIVYELALRVGKWHVESVVTVFENGT